MQNQFTVKIVNSINDLSPEKLARVLFGKGITELVRDMQTTFDHPLLMDTTDEPSSKERINRM